MDSFVLIATSAIHVITLCVQVEKKNVENSVFESIEKLIALMHWGLVITCASLYRICAE